MPKEAGSHGFFAEFDDGLRVTIANQIVIDHLYDAEDTVTKLIGTSVELVDGELVPIQVDYYQAADNAVVTLQWMGPSDTDYETIPTESLFHKVN
jgi:hypothetical protein